MSNINHLVLPATDCYLTCNGHIITEKAVLENGQVYHVVPRLVGGKGGFGSMLRAIGAQIEKTTNHEACRDISGRRMRDVNNEKKLKEWIGQKAEKDKQREIEKQERRERRRAMPNHKFEDETYHEQRKKVAENQEDAILQGLQKVNKTVPSCTATSETATTSGVKRKTTGTDSGPTVKSAKKTEWLGIDLDNLSDLDSDEDSETSLPEQGDGSPLPSNEDSCDPYPQTDDISKPQDTQDNLNISEHKNICEGDSNQEKKETNIIIKDMQKTEIDEKPEKDFKKGSITQSETSVGLLDSLKKVPPQIKKEEVKETCKKEEQVQGPVNLDDYNSTEDLQALGLDRLKLALIDRKMKCGGNLEQRAERLFSVKGLTEDQIPPSLLSKPSKKK
ncbi:Replication stress response regulator SDE2 [Mytilus edulis]|uniref:Replication stress response regulator SDE2 n=1 Tax=Mytilus edulis TaxID=6550 RepID=A0A8S3TNY0_MYTED|nr:Replication stress response regulator SDE2 [Mytilus edulis]